MNTARGRVLRDTAVGDGLISVAGKQYPFRLEGTWQSDRAPKVDMSVDVDFDDEGRIAAIRAVDPAAAAREQAERFMSTAQATAKQWAADLKTKGAPALAELRAKGAPALADLQTKGGPAVQRFVARVGVPTLAALAGVAAGWYFLDSVSIEFFGQRQSATFYDYLRILNNPERGFEGAFGGRRTGGAGLYGFLAFIALLAPLVPHFVKSRPLWLAYCAPAGWMVLAGVAGWWKMRSAMAEARSAIGAFGAEDFASGLASEFMNEIWNAISIGFGAYLAAAAAIYLAAVGVRRYRAPAPADAPAMTVEPS